jgi:hypothetical protein
MPISLIDVSALVNEEDAIDTLLNKGKGGKDAGWPCADDGNVVRPLAVHGLLAPILAA